MKVDSVQAPREMPLPPCHQNAGPQPVPVSNHDSDRTIKFENREPQPKAMDPAALREAVKSVVTEEIKVEIYHLWGSISGELEKALPAAVKSAVAASKSKVKLNQLRRFDFQRA